MSRFSRYDTDEERLPEGMTRAGYDADTQVYTFRDSDGSYWESAPGNQYGHLTRVSDGDHHDGDDSEPFLVSDQHYEKPSWRHDMMPLLNFGVIVGVCFLLLLWGLHYSAGSDEPMEPTCGEGTTSYLVQKDDSCWAIAKKMDVTVDEILKLNKGLDCDKLLADSQICLPSTSPV
ncbi:Fc.00g114890.m01.CDS01 [Cosmosporella sp. VM-42]